MVYDKNTLGSTYPQICDGGGHSHPINALNDAFETYRSWGTVKLNAPTDGCLFITREKLVRLVAETRAEHAMERIPGILKGRN